MLIDIGMMVAVYALWRFLQDLFHYGAGGGNADLSGTAKGLMVMFTLLAAGIVGLFAADLLSHATAPISTP